MFLGNGIAAGSSPSTGVGSLLFCFLACLARVDIFASGGFWSLVCDEEFLISENREKKSCGYLLDLEQSLERFELRQSLRRRKDGEY